MATSFATFSANEVVTHKKTIKGNIPHQIETILPLIRQHTSIKPFYDTKGGFITEIFTETDYIAIREIISNAFAHRDYTITDSITIKIYEDKILIINPGEFKEWNRYLQKKLTTSKKTNLFIAQYLASFSKFEGLGQGFNKIRDFIKRHGDNSITCNIESNGPFTIVEIKIPKYDSLNDKSQRVHIGDIIQYGESRIPRYLTQKPFFTDFFIGRDNDLASIETDYLQQNHLLVLVNGEGGMGKTTLAAQYWFKHENRYQHLAWIFADSGIGNALLSLADNLGIQFSPQDDERVQIARIIEGVNNLAAPCLLVFDNANNAEDLEHYFGTLRRLSNCHILLTSRVTALEGVPVHRVLPLDKDFTVELFKKHYTKHMDAERSLLDALLYAVGYNTLVIEVLAKNLAVFNKFQTQYSLASLVTDLQERGLLAVQGKAVKTLYQADRLRTETPDNIIAAMYDVSALTETERYLLNNFAILPAENIPYTIFKHLLKPAEADTLDTPLSSLQQKGWIDFYEATNEFKISPVIQHIIKRKNAVTLLNDCDMLIDTLIDELLRDKIHEDNYKMSTVFARYAETVVAAFDEPNFDAAILCQRIGTYYETVGNLDRAIVFYEKCNKISQELCERNPNNKDFKNSLAISYSKLGETHTSLGNLDTALGFYEDMTKLFKELYAAYPINVSFKNGLAISYEKLGNTHSALGNLDKAVEFYENEVKLFKELYSFYPTNVDFKNGLAISYSKLGETHTALGNLDKTLTFYEERNRLSKELYAAYPSNVSFKNSLAISHSKLGETHISLGNLDKALSFYEEEVKLFKELFTAYPSNVDFKNGLAISYSKLGETHTSLGNLNKALGFYEEYNRLEKELYAAYPTNVSFKNGLAISYSKLGSTHTALGNLDKALVFYEKNITLSKDLYAAYPTNVSFKNGLAISYATLGLFYKDNLKDKIKAHNYFKQAEGLWTELEREAPHYVQFQQSLRFIQENLIELTDINKAQPLINNIRELLAKDDLKTAILQLSDLLKYSPKLDEAVQQSSRYSNIMQQIRIGVVDYSSANIAINQIRYSILELLREVEEQEKASSKIKAEVEKYSKNEKNIIKNTSIKSGNITIGDVYTITQAHSGSGDNISGDKIIRNS